MVSDAIKELRREFFVKKGPRHIVGLAKEIGVTRQSLASFGQGKPTRIQVLQKIEAWLVAEAQE